MKKMLRRQQGDLLGMFSVRKYYQMDIQWKFSVVENSKV